VLISGGAVSLVVGVVGVAVWGRWRSPRVAGVGALSTPYHAAVGRWLGRVAVCLVMCTRSKTEQNVFVTLDISSLSGQSLSPSPDLAALERGFGGGRLAWRLAWSWGGFRVLMAVVAVGPGRGGVTMAGSCRRGRRR
jgi:hypothetical protein